jgi:F-type H+-transporting ATPase subunit alpha
MKLDYSRFLELEIFTRFGARLDPDMEAIINRGKILRELLKQDRFERFGAPLELAWMITYNEGLLDHQPPEDMHLVLDTLQNASAPLGVLNGLSLDSPRQDWIQALKRLIPQAMARATDAVTMA